jgi:site-specific recombinase XerD
LSSTSLTAYVRDLAEFADLVGANTVLDDIEKALTRIAQAPDRRYTRGAKIAADGTTPPGRSAHSRARWFVSVRGLFSWAADRGYVQIDPMTGLKAPKTPDAPREPLGLPLDDAALAENPIRPGRGLFPGQPRSWSCSR